jgi:hypothetical protein
VQKKALTGITKGSFRIVVYKALGKIFHKGTRQNIS